MRTDFWIDIDKSRLRNSSFMAVAFAAALALYGCGRGSQPNVSTRQGDANAPTTATKAADEAGPSGTAVSEPLPTKQAAAHPPLELGQRLYAQHCAPCHGERGDGKGIAAAFLFPKPRDFRAGRFRLTSTHNSVPTREDLHAVLIRGMPGSAMPPWAHLSQEERNALVEEVLQVRADGARESYVKQLKEDEDLTDEQIAAADIQKVIQDFVKNATTPGEGTAVPSIRPSTDEAIARGKTLYAKFVCISCHGETGRGDGVQQMVDEEKMPTSPRDFTLGIFKGSPDPVSVYRRIAFGMPGTPMPGSSSMTPEQMVDLVHYIRSLSTEEKRQAAILKREQIVAVRVDTIPASDQADE